MKPYRTSYSLAVFGAATFVAMMPASAVETDLADIPLANATTATILPNVALVMDDSGSMDWENMPDNGSANVGNHCYKWYRYNTIAYNPAHTYKAPIKADGNRYTDAVFTSALKDGYFASGAKMYDGSTTNSPVDLTALGTVTVTKAKIEFPDLGSSKHYASTLKITLLDGSKIELLGSTTVPNSSTSNEDSLAQAVRDSINEHAQITQSGFSASYSTSSNTLTITSPESQVNLATTPAITLVKTSGSQKTATPHAFVTTNTASGIYYATHKANTNSTVCDDDADYNIVNIKTNIAAPGATAGSAAALINYANWYSYYRKRAFLAKAGVGEAFSALGDNKYRIGFFAINSSNSNSNASSKPNSDLAIAAFTGDHRTNWFSKLYGTRSSGATPLRGALARMGQMYAGKISGWDPVQYSCQRNFTILTTDGYWNTDAERTSSPKYGPYAEDNSTYVADPDSAAGVTRPEYDGNNSGSSSVGTAQNTLADVAYYYYHTDLRPEPCADNKCLDNVPPVGVDNKVDDVAIHQHMTTFTLGLGVNGSLIYQEGYKSSTSGDYHDIQQGDSKNWPNPVDGSSDNPDRIDDLWHAAVNGRGTYLSASDPDSLARGLGSALGSITSASGSGAAAATSNLQPTAGDNYIYVANYRTVNWDGELSAYIIDLSSGIIASDTTWQAAALLDAKIASTGNSDTRTLYTSLTGSSPLVSFTWGNLDATHRAYLDNTKLSQYADWSAADKAAATGQTMLDYLRGQHRNEDQDRADSFGSYYRLYRDREKTLGDIVHSQPVYVAKPLYSFSDSGYSSFAAARSGRAKTVYVAANDGMLHAFDGTTGQERWAYVPAPMIKDMWRLADNDYATNHRFFVDGPIAVSDVDAGGWKTILVGALGKGGRGYYALDITDPSAPVALWKFTADDNPKLGYTYGMPLITKLADGTWVVVVASGYNNVPDGAGFATADGGGYVFVLDAATGAVIRTIGTGVGSTGSPAGLAHLNIKVADFQTDNTTLQAYGGDLLGNLWRFDLDAGTASKVAALGASRSISAAPELGEIDGKTVLYFGTGRYLGSTDLDDTQTQAIYAIRDDGSTSVGTGQLIAQSMGGSGSSRTVTTTAVDWASDYGWYLELPDVGERVHLPAQLYFGTLLIASVVPAANECQPGGYSWMYFLDYRTGGGVDDNVAAVMFTSPLVGFTVARLPGGTPKVYGITADGGFPKGAPPTLPISTAGGGGAGSGKRVMWRELLD